MCKSNQNLFIVNLIMQIDINTIDQKKKGQKNWFKSDNSIDKRSTR